MQYASFIVTVVCFLACASGPPATPSIEKPSASVDAQPTPTPEIPPEKKLTEHAIGESKIGIEETISRKVGPIYFRPHEDESTSGDATRVAIAKHGGKLVELRSKGGRMIDFTIRKKVHKFDPNRIYTKDGIKKTLGAGYDSAEAVTAVKGFVDKLLRDHLADRKLIVAVHNNTDAGPLTIKTYVNNPEVLDVSINPEKDIDDFFYLTSREHFDFLKARGFNVVLQNGATVVDDGSFSVYCAKEGISYINVEAERGHLDEQVAMLNVLNEALAAFPR